DVGRLDADLPTDAAAGETDEDRIAPATIRLANEQDATTVPAANDEAGLDDIGNDRHALGITQQYRRNAGQVAAGQVAKNLGRRIDRLILVAPGQEPAAGQGGQGEAGQQDRVK